MADGIPGSKGNPHFLGGGPPAAAGDPNDVSDWAAANIDATVPTFGDLATLAYTWPGMRRTVEATGRSYLFYGGGWIEVPGMLTNIPASTVAWSSGWAAEPEFKFSRVGTRAILSLSAKKATAIIASEGIAFLPVFPAKLVRFPAAFYGSGSAGMLELLPSGQLITTGVVPVVGATIVGGTAPFDIA